MNKFKRKFLSENYGRLSEKYLANRLGESLATIRHEAFLMGLSGRPADRIRKLVAKKSKAGSGAPVERKLTRKPKPDMSRNPSGVASAPSDHLVSLRIDARTVILIPENADPEVRKARYLRMHSPARGAKGVKTGSSFPEEPDFTELSLPRE